MANRYIDTRFYRSPFVRSLKGPFKTLYSFIICDCDGSGIWVMDLEVASVLIGYKVNEKEFKDFFVKTGKAIDLNNGKFFFPDFIEHQYPKGLSATNPAHVNFILELKKYKLIDDDLKVLSSPSKGTYVMVKEKVIVMEKVMEDVTVRNELQNFVFENLPNVKKMDSQLTEIECQKLISAYGIEKVIKKLQAMENWKGINKKNKSVYLTLCNWMEKDNEKEVVVKSKIKDALDQNTRIKLMNNGTII